MNASSLFWGVLFILGGILMILFNAGLLPSNFWIEIWRYWPVLLILLGLSLLFSRSGSISAWLSAILILLIIASVGFFGWVFNKGQITPSSNNSTSSGDTQTTKISEDVSEGLKEATINIKFGASQLVLGSSSNKLIEGTIDSFGAPEIRSSIQNDKATVDIDQIARGPFGWSHNTTNMLDLKVVKDVPLTLSLDTGASKISADLSETELQSMDIKSGAISADIKLGDKIQKTTVNISTGASSYVLRLPKDSGIKIINNSGISSNNFRSVGLSQSGEVWTSDNYDSSAKQIEISFSAGASSLRIEKY